MYYMCFWMQEIILYARYINQLDTHNKLRICIDLEERIGF